jgi:hypothetical protein
VKRTALFLVIGLTLSSPGWTQRVFPPQDVPAGPRGPVIGNTLFFNGWVKAKVVSHNAFFRNDSMYLFDLDKASQDLLATADKETIYKINKREFESVTFYSGASTFTFGHVPAINDRNLFLEIIKNDDKYSLYVLIHNEIRGNAYIDWYTYYILFPFPDTRAVKLNVLDKKLIDHAFELSSDRQKVDAYYSLHDKETHNEYFLKKLIEYLNE